MTADSETPAADSSNPRWIGRFAVTGRLGAGAMGVVYAAYDPQLDRKVAVKLLKTDGPGDSGTRWQHRLLREAQALAKLSHPNVVQIHEVGSHGEGVFVAMEFVTGVTLRTWLSEQPRSWPEVVAVFVEAGRGLAAAHAAGLVHRDIKPENFLVGADGRVRVVDFGLVRFDVDDDLTETHAPDLAQAAQLSPTSTAPGLLVGTPAYMSPEQYRGRPADALSDQFSFCVSLYEALHGERPFGGATAQEVSRSVLSGQIALRPDRHVPTWLSRIVLRGLASERTARFPSMDALVAELARDRGRPRRLAARAAVMLLAAAAALMVASWVGKTRARHARERAEELAAGRLEAAEASIDTLLAEGRRGEAAALFDAFVTVPEHRGTAAFVRAFRGWGERMRLAGDLAAARMSYAQAYAAAEDPRIERAVLGELARLFHEQWSWDQLAGLCAVLQRSGAGDAEAWAGRCAEAAFARRDLADIPALAARSPDLADLVPIAAAWATALRTDRPLDTAGPVDLDGDGTRALFVYSQSPAPGRLDILRADASLAPLHRYIPPARVADRPGVHLLSLRTDDPPIVLTWSPAHRRVALSAAGPDRLAELFDLLADEPLAALAADLDRDGARELYLGTGPYGRQLLVLRRDAEGTWHTGQAHPGTDATNSDINALLAADLDGDGRDELAVAAGAWRAFDVRVLRAGEGGGLELVARRKLGDVAALAALRGEGGELLLVAGKTDAYPSRVVFSPDAPAGPPAGLYFLRLAGKTLETVRFLPAPRREGAPRPLDIREIFIGDIDGDGLDDIVAAVRDIEPLPPLVLVYRQRPDGSFARMMMGGLIPHALLDLDGDPARELVVRAAGPGESTLWVLGAGSDPLPPQATAHTPPQGPPPPISDPVLARAWSRAEQLAALGLSSEAARALDDLGGLVADAPARATALLRAAELHEAAGEFLTAAERYEQAHGSAGTAALQGAARCYEQADRFADALRVTRILATQSDLPRAEAERTRARLPQLAAIVDDVEVTALRFDQPLRSPWQVDDPTSIHQDLASRRLHVDAFAGQGPIARVPFEWSTGPLGVEVDLAVERAEWGSGLVVGLRRPGSSTLLFSVGVEVLGGGGIYTRRLACRPPGAREDLLLVEEPGEDPARPGAVRLAVDILPDLGLVTCSARAPGAGPPGSAPPPAHTRRATLPSDALPAPGRYELVLLPRAFGDPTTLWFSASIDAITVRGAHLQRAPEDETPRALAALLLAQGESEAALAELDRVQDPGPLAPIWRALALSELGRWPEASDALRLLVPAERPTGHVHKSLSPNSPARPRPAARDPVAPAPRALASVSARGPELDPDARAALLRLLRTRGQTVAPLVRSVFGAGYFRLFWDAIDRSVQHHGDPLIGRTLTTALSDLGEFLPDPTLPDEQALKVRLLFERGRAWARLGQTQRARADLGAAAALAELLPPDRRDLHAIDLERAALEAPVDPDTAIDHARRAIRHAPAPELAADRLRSDPRFAPLQNDPAWLALLE